MHWEIVWQYLPYLLEGAWNTILLTTAGISAGVVLGTLIGLARLAGRSAADARRNPSLVRRAPGVAGWARAFGGPIIARLAAVYVDFFRGTPLLVQILLVYMGLPALLGFSLERWTAAVLTLSLNSAAYIAEIVRGGIQSIERGQTEAGLASGLTPVQTMRHIVLPQALRRMIPPLGNEFVALLKDSSLVMVIALEELLRRGQLVVTRTFRPFEIYLAIAVMYLIMTKLISWFVAYVERRASLPRRGSAARASAARGRGPYDVPPNGPGGATPPGAAGEARSPGETGETRPTTGGAPEGTAAGERATT